MADHKFKIGDRVIIHPDSGYAEWRGITGTVRVVGIDGATTYVDLDKRPEGWGHSDVGMGPDSIKWLRPLKPLSPLEELIVAYVEAQKAELGI